VSRRFGWVVAPKLNLDSKLQCQGQGHIEAASSVAKSSQAQISDAQAASQGKAKSEARSHDVNTADVNKPKFSRHSKVPLTIKFSSFDGSGLLESHLANMDGAQRNVCAT